MVIKGMGAFNFVSVENQKHLSIIRQLLLFYVISSRKVQEHVRYGENLQGTAWIEVPQYDPAQST